MPTKSANNAIELGYINYIPANNTLNFIATPISGGAPIVDATAGVYANGAFAQANAAFNSANNVAPQIQPAFDKANAAYNRANNSLNANTGGTVTGSLSVVGDVSANFISSVNSSGEEGGEIRLSTSNSSYNMLAGGNVTVDIWRNRFRIFESGGGNRGVFVDIANSAANGVGSEIVKYDANNSSTGYISVPLGSTAQRPGTPVNGSLRYNTTTNILEVYINGWLTLIGASYQISMLAVGGGGGGGGIDGGNGGAGGGAGAVVEGVLTVSPGTTLTIGVGGGGTGGVNNTAGSGGGPGGTNGGGPGGNAGGSGASGAGGGGGGWSGVYSGSTFYIVAGGGSGGGGGGEGPANDGTSSGGGIQTAGVNGTSFTGGTGANYGGDGGGFAGGGGGRYGGAGSSSSSTSGGGNYADGAVSSAVLTNGSNSSGGTGGAAVSYVWTGYPGGYGAGQNGSVGGGTAGNGIVIIRYPGAQRGTGGSVTSSGGYTYHVFTTPGTSTFTA